MKKLSFSLEKYLFAIFELSLEVKKVTPKILQEKLGFNKASTLEGVKSLQVKGFVEYYPHKGMSLTNYGLEYAKEISKRKETISNFLETFLFIEKEKLPEIVNSIEWNMDDFLIERFNSFLSFSSFCPCSGPKWIEGFKNYLENGEMTEKCADCIEKSICENKAPDCKSLCQKNS